MFGDFIYSYIVYTISVNNKIHEKKSGFVDSGLVETSDEQVIDLYSLK